MNQGVCIFGEVLFDHFPDGQRVLGGAPFNVAWNLQALGQQVHFISRVGHDEEGAQVREAMRAWAMDTSGLQTDEQCPTGKVTIHLKEGEPAYDIVAPCAYDRIQPVLPTLACNILYHGTLALRDPVSRNALKKLLALDPEMVFIDVNLRSPWWEKPDVLEQLNQAHWVKLNAQELQLLSSGDADKRDKPDELIDRHQLQGLILTHGDAGAEVFTSNKEHFEIAPTRGAQVVDTVGAGDAFASVVLMGLAYDWPLATTLERAQSFASSLVEQRGATVNNPGYYKAFIYNWRQ